MSKKNIYSLNAEQAILGGLLINNAVWANISELLSTNDFFFPIHSLVFKTIEKFANQNRNFDPLIISEELKNNDLLKDKNVYIFELAHNTPTFQFNTIIAYANIVREKSIQRKINKCAEELKQNSDNLEQIDRIKNKLASLSLAQRNTSTVLGRYADSIHQKPIDWLWHDRLACGCPSIIAGHPGLGKSQLAINIIATVTSGGFFPLEKTPCQKGSAILISAEDSLETTIAPRLRAADADISRVYVVEAVQDETRKRPFNLQTDLVKLEPIVKEMSDVRILVVDPITAYLGNIDSHKNADIRALMLLLSDFACKYNIMIFAISHLTKGNTNDAVLNITGSLAFAAAARAVYVVVNDPKDDSKTIRLFLPVKNNLGDSKTGFAFSIEQVVLPDKITTSKTVWGTQLINENINDIMRDQSMGEEERSALDEAIEFLENLIDERPLLVAEIKNRANKNGISWRTIERAKRKLNLKRWKVGFQREWYWGTIEQIKSLTAKDDG